MTPHETGSTATPGDPRATAPLTRTFGPQGPTLGDLSDAYLQDYQVRQFRIRGNHHDHRAAWATDGHAAGHRQRHERLPHADFIGQNDARPRA